MPKHFRHIDAGEDMAAGLGYRESMARASTTSSRSAMNLWVRKALDHAGMSQQQLSEILTRRGLGSYGRSTINKMTISRAVRMDEAAAIAEVTGYPIPAPEDLMPHMDAMARVTPEQMALLDEHGAPLERYALLAPAQRRLVCDLVVEILERSAHASLGKHFTGLILRQVGSSRYESAEDVLRSGLRLLEEGETLLISKHDLDAPS